MSSSISYSDMSPTGKLLIVLFMFGVPSFAMAGNLFQKRIILNDITQMFPFFFLIFWLTLLFSSLISIEDNKLIRIVIMAMFFISIISANINVIDSKRQKVTIIHAVKSVDSQKESDKTQDETFENEDIVIENEDIVIENEDIVINNEDIVIENENDEEKDQR